MRTLSILWLENRPMHQSVCRKSAARRSKASISLTVRLKVMVFFPSIWTSYSHFYLKSHYGRQFSWNQSIGEIVAPFGRGMLAR
jgi:hypothetical protein